MSLRRIRSPRSLLPCRLGVNDHRARELSIQAPPGLRSKSLDRPACHRRATRWAGQPTSTYVRHPSRDQRGGSDASPNSEPSWLRASRTFNRQRALSTGPPPAHLTLTGSGTTLLRKTRWPRGGRDLHAPPADRRWLTTKVRTPASTARRRRAARGAPGRRRRARAARPRRQRGPAARCCPRATPPPPAS